MHVSVAVTIKASRASVWSLVSSIEGAARTISAIEDIQILERPGDGLLGLKWRETRRMFGKTATETMWITQVDEGSSYSTEARSHGSIYRTRVQVAEAAEGTSLSMVFSAEATTLVAKFLSVLFGPLVKRSIRKALVQDLEDIRAAAEGQTAREHAG